MIKLISALFVTLLAVIIYQNKSYILNFLLHMDNSKAGHLYSRSELRQYNGIEKSELYLSILGNVFNVTKGIKHYGPGETYHTFVGQDASRSFVTGKFTGSDVSDDVKGLTNQELLSLNNWLQFYKKEYPKIGKLIGRYYNNQGKSTQYCKEVKKLIKGALRQKDTEEVEKLKFPLCNVEWDVERGSRVWCTKRSGGIERNWVGVPRKYYEPGSNSYRCACISKENMNIRNIKEYEECDSDASSCYVHS